MILRLLDAVCAHPATHRNAQSKISGLIDGLIFMMAAQSTALYWFLHPGAKSPGSSRQYLLLVALLVSLCAAGQKPAQSASLHGIVHDSQGNPVVQLEVSLERKNSHSKLTAATDSQGRYNFEKLQEGIYRIEVFKETKVGAECAYIDPLILKPHESRTLDLTLEELQPGRASFDAGPQFFDQPQFSVSGVTDTTSLGGHGSDTVVRTRDSIAKDTTALSKADAGPSEVAPEVANLLRGGNYAEARDQVSRLLSRQDTAALHHLLGSIDEKLGNSLSAVHEYQHAAQMDPTEPYIFDWASELLLHHAPEPAAEVFDKGTKLFPKSTRMWIGLGAASFARGSNEQAVRQVCTASDLNPGDPAPYLFLGKMQHVEKNPSGEVLEKLHRFVTLQPQNAQANYYYAVALWKNRGPLDTSRATQAESLLANSIRLDPEFAD